MYLSFIIDLYYKEYFTAIAIGFILLLAAEELRKRRGDFVINV